MDTSDIPEQSPIIYSDELLTRMWAGENVAELALNSGINLEFELGYASTESIRIFRVGAMAGSLVCEFWSIVSELEMILEWIEQNDFGIDAINQRNLSFMQMRLANVKKLNTASQELSDTRIDEIEQSICAIQSSCSEEEIHGLLKSSEEYVIEALLRSRRLSEEQVANLKLRVPGEFSDFDLIPDLIEDYEVPTLSDVENPFSPMLSDVMFKIQDPTAPEVDLLAAARQQSFNVYDSFAESWQSIWWHPNVTATVRKVITERVFEPFERRISEVENLNSDLEASYFAGIDPRIDFSATLNILGLYSTLPKVALAKNPSIDKFTKESLMRSTHPVISFAAGQNYSWNSQIGPTFTRDSANQESLDSDNLFRIDDPKINESGKKLLGEFVALHAHKLKFIADYYGELQAGLEVKSFLQYDIKMRFGPLAVAVLSKDIELRSTKVLNNLGNVYERLRDFLTPRPEEPVLEQVEIYWQANELKESGNDNEAIKLFTRAAEMGMPSALASLSWEYLLSGQVELGLTEFERLLPLAKPINIGSEMVSALENSNSLSNGALLYIANNADLDKAYALIESAWHPDNIEAKYIKGWLESRKPSKDFEILEILSYEELRRLRALYKEVANESRGWLSMWIEDFFIATEKIGTMERHLALKSPDSPFESNDKIGFLVRVFNYVWHADYHLDSQFQEGAISFSRRHPMAGPIAYEYMADEIKLCTEKAKSWLVDAGVEVGSILFDSGFALTLEDENHGGKLSVRHAGEIELGGSACQAWASGGSTWFKFSTGFDCHAEVATLYESSNSNECLGFVILTYGPWADSSLGELLMQFIGSREIGDELPSAFMSNGIKRAFGPKWGFIESEDGFADEWENYEQILKNGMPGIYVSDNTTFGIRTWGMSDPEDLSDVDEDGTSTEYFEIEIPIKGELVAFNFLVGLPEEREGSVEFDEDLGDWNEFPFVVLKKEYAQKIGLIK